MLEHDTDSVRTACPLQRCSTELLVQFFSPWLLSRQVPHKHLHAAPEGRQKPHPGTAEQQGGWQNIANLFRIDTKNLLPEHATNPQWLQQNPQACRNLNKPQEGKSISHYIEFRAGLPNPPQPLPNVQKQRQNVQPAQIVSVQPLSGTPRPRRNANAAQILSAGQAPRPEISHSYERFNDGPRANQLFCAFALRDETCPNAQCKDTHFDAKGFAVIGPLPPERGEDDFQIRLWHRHDEKTHKKKRNKRSRRNRNNSHRR